MGIQAGKDAGLEADPHRAGFIEKPTFKTHKRKAIHRITRVNQETQGRRKLLLNTMADQAQVRHKHYLSTGKQALTR